MELSHSHLIQILIKYELEINIRGLFVEDKLY
jgi:hypothetical protein